MWFAADTSARRGDTEDSHPPTAGSRHLSDDEGHDADDASVPPPSLSASSNDAGTGGSRRTAHSTSHGAGHTHREGDSAFARADLRAALVQSNPVANCCASVGHREGCFVAAVVVIVTVGLYLAEGLPPRATVDLCATASVLVLLRQCRRGLPLLWLPFLFFQISQPAEAMLTVSDCAGAVAKVSRGSAAHLRPVPTPSRAGLILSFPALRSDVRDGTTTRYDVSTKTLSPWALLLHFWSKGIGLLTAGQTLPKLWSSQLPCTHTRLLPVSFPSRLHFLLRNIKPPAWSCRL